MFSTAIPAERTAAMKWTFGNRRCDGLANIRRACRSVTASHSLLDQQRGVAGVQVADEVEALDGAG